MHGEPRSLVQSSKTVREQLEVEFAKMIQLARRVRQRVEYAFTRTADTRDLPGPEVIEYLKYHRTVIIEAKKLLANQPDKLESKLTEAEIEAELQANFIERLKGLTASERRELLQRLEDEPESSSSMIPTRHSRWDK